MSTGELPEDLTHWPEDPYDLLGVRPGISPRQLRRACIDLARRFPRDRYPEHFHRIRAAYRIIRHRPASSEGAPALPPGDEAAPPRQPRKPGKGWRRVPKHRLPRQMDALWQSACVGNEALAYRRLSQFHARYPGQADVCLRLYWLLTVRPDLDARRSPCDWLVRGLHASGLAGPLRELYRREVLDRPEEALSARCDRLLYSRVQPELLLELAEWRWQAAARLRRWEVVAADLEELRQWMVRDAEETWVRLLLLAVEQLAWADGPVPHPSLEHYCRELDQFAHLADRLGEAWGRREFVLGLARGWRTLRRDGRAPGPLLQLVQLAAVRPFDELRPLLATVIEHLVRNPLESLEELDGIHARAPAVLTRFGQLMQLQEKDMALTSEARSLTDLTRITLDFLDGEGRLSYGTLRPRLLAFCLREAVAPEVLAEIVDGRLGPWFWSSDHLARAIAADWPMRYLYQAHRLFRS